MTREEVITLAHKANINVHTGKSFAEDLYIERLEGFAAAVAAHEREQHEGLIRELLEALEEVLGWETLCPIEVYEQARSAIAKAKGES